MSNHHIIVRLHGPGELGALQLVLALGVMAGVGGEGFVARHHAGTGLLDCLGGKEHGEDCGWGLSFFHLVTKVQIWGNVKRMDFYFFF